MVTNQHGVIEKVNPAFTSLTGYQISEVIGKTPSILRSGKHDKNFYQEMWSSIRKNGFWQGEIWNQRKNNELFLEWLTISEVKNDAGEVKYYVGMFSDITDKNK
jgi:MFS transporter, NNP family, nitrate/nitrite transporter